MTFEGSCGVISMQSVVRLNVDLQCSEKMSMPVVAVTLIETSSSSTICRLMHADATR